MAFEQEINNNNPKHQEFAKLLDQDLRGYDHYVFIGNRS